MTMNPLNRPNNSGDALPVFDNMDPKERVAMNGTGKIIGSSNNDTDADDAPEAESNRPPGGSFQGLENYGESVTESVGMKSQEWGRNVARKNTRGKVIRPGGDAKLNKLYG